MSEREGEREGKGREKGRDREGMESVREGRERGEREEESGRERGEREGERVRNKREKSFKKLSTFIIRIFYYQPLSFILRILFTVKDEEAGNCRSE